MKNLRYFKGDCFEFFKNVLNSKRNTKKDPDYKTRVSALSPSIERQYQIYKSLFEKDQLTAITSLGYVGNNRSDLQNLYDYRNSHIQKLKVELTTDENNRVSNTCQHCTISEITSFDHYLPQSEFSEFAVNPLNLIPSCSGCNGHKSTIWHTSSTREFLNLYIDTLPVEQYLFVNVTYDGNSITLKYFLENKHGIDDGLFTMITKHYTRLDLCHRFKGNSDSIISELDIEFKKYLLHLPIESICETVIEECRDAEEILGRNHWKLVLKRALVEDTTYLSRFNKLLTVFPNIFAFLQLMFQLCKNGQDLLEIVHNWT